jgi:hypothetical protein
LLASRRIDGAEQYSPAPSISGSQNRRETLQKWDRNKVLGDVVPAFAGSVQTSSSWSFSGTPRDGHGHRQASSIQARSLSLPRSDQVPEQLAYVEPWTPKLLMMNAGGPAVDRIRAKAKPRGSASSGS